MESDTELAAYLSFAEPDSDPTERHAYLHEICRLPPELLARIFNFCLPTASQSDQILGDPIPRRDEAPLLTAQICRWWREITLTTPALWDHVKVLALQDRMKPDIETTKLWLVRSGSRPLTLSLAFQHSLDLEGTQGIAISAFLEHASRWKKIDFLLSGVLSPEVWEIFGQTEAPLLVDADIKIRTNLKSPGIDALSRLVCSGPRLTRLVWSHPLARPSIEAPWHQLTTLWLHSPLFLSQLLSIFQQCTKLTSCMVVPVLKVGWRATPSEHSVHTPIHLPLLRSFDARIYTDAPTIPELFDVFTLPKLEKLTITIARGSTLTPAWPQREYLSFIARSKASLNALILESVEIHDDQLITCLEQSPGLRRLSISGRVVRNVTNELLRRLTLVPHETEEGVVELHGLCPLLETIQFRDGCLWSSDGLLAEMARSRWQPGTVEGLWSLSAEFTLSVDQEHELDHEVLQKLRAEGLSLDLEDIPGQRLAIGWF